MTTSRVVPPSMDGRVVGEATCLCEVCLQPVGTTVIVARDAVWYLKRCDTHGIRRSLVSNDPTYYLASIATRSAGYPRTADRAVALDAPLGATQSEVIQTSGAAVVIMEIVEGCDASCPTCSAASAPRVSALLDLEAARAVLRSVRDQAPTAILALSGGEPALHPQLLEIIKEATESGFSRVLLVTNGFRIARDEAFVKALSELGTRLEVYLQFDSLRAAVLEDLRGADLRDVRLMALEHLERHNVSTTLVAVVKKGLNDEDCGSVIDFAKTYKCVRGVTFQPIRAVGRTEGFNPQAQCTTLSDVRRAIVASGHFDEAGLRAHPRNPENVCIGYQLKATGSSLTEAIFGAGDAREVGGSGSPFFWSPETSLEHLQYSDVFRVAIVSYLDRFDFSFEAARRSCIYFVDGTSRLVPLEVHYLFPANQAPLAQSAVPLRLVRRSSVQGPAVTTAPLPNSATLDEGSTAPSGLS